MTCPRIPTLLKTASVSKVFPGEALSSKAWVTEVEGMAIPSGSVISIQHISNGKKEPDGRILLDGDDKYSHSC